MPIAGGVTIFGLGEFFFSLDSQGWVPGKQNFGAHPTKPTKRRGALFFLATSLYLKWMNVSTPQKKNVDELNFLSNKGTIVREFSGV